MSARKGRARPAEPLADWCELRSGVCTGRATDRHHILRRAQGGTDDATNTADLCHTDHLHVIHGNPAWARRHGWLVRTGDTPITPVSCPLTCPEDHRE